MCLFACFLIQVPLTDHTVLACQPPALFIWKYLTAVSTPPVGQLWRTYYYAGGQRIAVRERTATTDELTYLHPSRLRAGSDHLGSTSLTTDAAGDVVARRRYAPYGKERWAAGALPTDFGFTHDSATLGALGQAGQRDVPGTGLMYYHARYYHPALRSYAP